MVNKCRLPTSLFEVYHHQTVKFFDVLFERYINSVFIYHKRNGFSIHLLHFICEKIEYRVSLFFNFTGAITVSIVFFCLQMNENLFFN